MLGRLRARAAVTESPAAHAGPDTAAPDIAAEDAALRESAVADAVADSVVERPIPNVVSAAWELELLIAGAVTFALFQLPGSIDTLREFLVARVGGKGEFAVTMGYVYAKAIVYSLIAAFVTNLAARAYWVGLVGLHSVYPRGVKWDQLGMGPISVETYRTRISSLPAVMSRVDNFASIIFSFAFLIVTSFLFSVVALSVLGGIAYVLSAWLFDGRHVMRMVYAVMLGVMLVLSAAALLDKYVSRRLDPEGAAYRRLRATVRFTSRASGMTIFGPIFFTLFSNIGRHRMLLLFYVALLGSLSVVVFELLGSVGALKSGSPLYVPEDGDVRGVDASYYESLRAPDPLSVAPTIQSDVITGPYVRLFIPYDAERHDPALGTGCPGLTPLRPGRPHVVKRSASSAGDSVAADRALGCLRAMHAISLDGTPRPDVPFRFHVHPRTGREGMVAYIPTAPLASGMHTVRIMPPPRAPDSPRRKEPLRPYEIVFWK